MTVRKLPTHAVAKLARLADHDGDSLAKRIQADTRVPFERAERAANRALRHAFAKDAYGDALWTADALATAGLGEWVRPTLLAHSPASSLSIAERARSEDGTTRLLFKTWDGHFVESVIIPTDAGRKRPRTTLCISSQVGCSRACTFCETGTLGLTRQLSSGEIVDQYRLARRICEDEDRPIDVRHTGEADDVRARYEPTSRRAAQRPISNIVFMGMGEPMDNLPEVIRSISLLCNQRAFDFAPSRITVSTVGCADKLEEFFTSTRAELAISLNAPDDARRSRIMPINDRFDMAALKAALLEHAPSSRRILFQYALFKDFNDSVADADAVAKFVEGVRCRINVIPANPGPDPTLVAPDMPAIDRFVGRLREHGVTTLLRLPRGRDVGGACGQLAGAARKRSEMGRTSTTAEAPKP